MEEEVSGGSIGVKEEEVSWWSGILDGDKVDGRQILEWTDHSVRDSLSKVGCKTRGPDAELLSER